MVFDYGEHDQEAPSNEESVDWPARQDAFSTCRSGFEIRTYRLCRRVLMFHRFSELEENDAPVPLLVRSTDFVYEEGPVVTYLREAKHTGYLWDGEEYDPQSLPAVALDYSRATYSDEVKTLEAETSRYLPRGIDGRAYQWVDLDGEGVAGVLSQQGPALYYERNLGQGRLAPARVLKTQPVQARAGQQLTDVTGDGLPDLVEYGYPTRGFHPRTDDGEWGPLESFGSLPHIDWADPSLRFIDLDGDGFADVMMSEDHVYTWYPSLRAKGFGEAQRTPRFTNEDAGPAVVFAEYQQTVFLADMTGDGLSDLVRIRNGSVCYWPNLGYGRFGAMVVMGNAPSMAPENLYSPSRVRLADLDGSGPADLLYLGDGGVKVWRNQSGNGFGAGETLAIFPGDDALSTVDVIDVLGNGTSCLVWATPLPGRPPYVRYVDLLGGVKPHLLTSIQNNLGLESTIRYTTSTKFYLEDRDNGVEWATRLPFPVQVVDRVEHYDHISKNRFVSTYRYRHGFYDAEEREFRGFGYVEQRDAESVGKHFGRGELPSYPVANDEMPQPPVVTRTWFHTGAWIKREALFEAFEKEWFENEAEPRLRMPAMEKALNPVELHQAHRALAGRMLRQEVYAEDGSPEATLPYVVSQQSWRVTRVQPLGSAAYASFLTVAHESLSVQYERGTEHPRIAHQMTLAVDELGYATMSAAIAYGHAATADYTDQERTWVVATEHSFHHVTDEDDWYRHGVPKESTVLEVGSGLTADGLFTIEEVKGAVDGWARLDFDDDTFGDEDDQLRYLGRTRQRYWNDAVDTPLAFGAAIGSLALPYETYTMALTSAMLSGPLAGGGVDETVVTVKGGYKEAGDLPGFDDVVATTYWAASGTQHFAPAAFYLVDEVTDVFGNDTSITYDGHHLFATEVENALALTVSAEIDYRVLAPKKVTDPNANFVEAAFDELGRVIATAVHGADPGEGDTLEHPTTKLTYELARFAASGLPVRVKTEMRETHADLGTRWLVSFGNSDGSGHEVMTKVLAEPGLAPELDEDGAPVFVGDELQYEAADPRWVGTGRTVFDNKGNPIKQYEPYFSATEEYEDDPNIVDWGVTPILHYDPLGRLIRSDLPDGTFSRVAFDPWKQTVWDANDTAEEGQPWFDKMTEVEDTPEYDAAEKAHAHFDTPTYTYFDALGRPFAVKENTGSEDVVTKSELDVQGNVLTLVDALDRSCMTYAPGMIGQVLEQTSIDAGRRRMFATAAGEPVRTWGERGFVQRAEYDDIRRLTHVYVDDGDEVLVERLVYGETHDDAVTRYTKGRLVAHYDQAGVVVTDRFDFKGNLVEQLRRYAVDYQGVIDWTAIEGDDDHETALATASSALEAETFTHAYVYDALNRPTSITTPDDSEVLPGYNIAGLLESVAAHVRGAGGSPTAFITNIDYDEKGRRQKIEYANGTETAYEYNSLSFRLEHFTTKRSDDQVLQSLKYVYDAVGNIVFTIDTAPPDVYFEHPPSNPFPEGGNEFTYDAVYRLIEATGREHAASTSSQRDHDDIDVQANIPHPANPAGLREYTQSYAYDVAGNITSFAHAPLTGSGGFTRTYEYVTGTNRLETTSFGGGTVSYSHDAHGNMDEMPHLAGLDWDYADRLKHVEKTSGQDVYFVYDASGARVRKVFVHGSGGSIVEDRKYLGGYEVYRKSISSTLEDERETLHIADDRSRVCMVETLTVESGSAVGTLTPRYRYQLDNHLGTVSVEVDDAGAVISYEEYHPYGTSAYRAFQGEVSAKRYRYIGCERDEETGLYLMGARYFAAWLGRWTAADPAGTVDGTNLYAYVRGSPVALRDPNGTEGEGWDMVAEEEFRQAEVAADAGIGPRPYRVGQQSRENKPEPVRYDQERGAGPAPKRTKRQVSGIPATGIGQGGPEDLSDKVMIVEGAHKAIVPKSWLQAPMFLEAEPRAGVLIYDFEPPDEPLGPPPATFQVDPGAQTSGQTDPPYPYGYVPATPLQTERINDIDMPVPDPRAEGRAHTTIGGTVSSNTGRLYRQSAEFPGGTWVPGSSRDIPWGRVDWYNHGQAEWHTTPHIHEYTYDWTQRQWREGSPRSWYPRTMEPIPYQPVVRPFPFSAPPARRAGD